MKAFHELTADEVLALDETRIAYYVDLACAEAGVPLLPPDPGSRPAAAKAGKDVTAYAIDDVYFADAGDAAKVAGLVNSLPRLSVRYVSGPGYERVAEKTSAPVVVKPEAYYTPETWGALGALVNAANLAQKDHDKAVAERSEISRKRDDASSSVRERIDEIRDERREFERYSAEFSRYLELANGDAEVAGRFLAKARPAWAKYLPTRDDTAQPVPTPPPTTEASPSPDLPLDPFA